MPLPTPILDDRSWDQIREELIRRIPVYTEEWTDHHPGDPGVTLIELFAHLSESLLFRFNQIPEATYLAFLDLLDVPLRPASSARGMITVETRAPEGILIPLGSEARAGEVPFETRTELHAWPVTTIAIAKRREAEGPLPGTEEEEAALAAQDEYRRRAGGDVATEPDFVYYVTERVPDEPAAPGADAVDFGATVDGAIWVAVLSTRHTHEAALEGALLNIGFLLDEEVPSMEEGEICPGPGSGPRTPAMLWEISAAPSAESVDPDARFRTLAVEGDGTAGLTRSGVVRLRLPDDALDWGPLVELDPDAAGAGDLPPALEDDDEAGRVLFWLRGSRLGDGPALEGIRWIGANAAPLVQNRAAALEFVGSGTGQEGQRYRLLHAPVVRDTLDLQLQEGGPDGAWRSWVAVETLAASGPDDRHFVLDLEAGEVSFGDGIRGRAPQPGERIRATGYRFGGGSEGNVPAEAVSLLPGFPSLGVRNPLPARGGAEGESIEDALERVPGEVRRRDRAVTADDFRELAAMTPTVDVGRAEVLPRVHPHRPTRETPGAVSVVVWPAEDAERRGAPMPDRNFLQEVCRYLDPRRLVTTEVWVIPPTYRRVAVAVGVEVKEGYGIEAVRRWVELVLRQYLAPLPPYGPEGHGWPLGRRVHGPELEAAALQVEGVHFLAEDVRLAEWNASAERWDEVDRSVTLEPWEVVDLVELTVVAGPPLEPGTGLGATVRGPAVALPLPETGAEC